MAHPLISIVTPVYEPPVDVLSATIESVRAQTFTDWEWVLVDDCSPNPEVRQVLRRYSELDPRIRVVERETNGHIVAASNDGLERAQGDFIAFIDHDDLIEPNALELCANVISAFDDVDYIYTDEDKVDEAGRFFDEVRKQPWSPERLRGHMYTSHLSVMRASLVREVGGFHDGFDGSQDHDLVLRVTERARRVEHVPEVVYHWRAIPGSAALDADAKPYARLAGLRAVQAQLDRLRIPATAVQTPHQGHYNVDRRPVTPRLISVVIPTLGVSQLVSGERRSLVIDAVRSVLDEVDTPDSAYEVEIIVVHDVATPISVLDELRAIAGDRLVPILFEAPFNFSWKINLGVAHARGDVLLVLNDDVVTRTAGWLANLVEPLSDPAVGLTGAKLYFPDGRIQHAGHSYSGAGFTNLYITRAGADPGLFGAAVVNRDVAGVTAACMAMRTEVFELVGGFCEELPNNYNDVDFCLKVRRSGLRVIFVANADLVHHESPSRDPHVRPAEYSFMAYRWGAIGDDAFTPAI